MQRSCCLCERTVLRKKLQRKLTPASLQKEFYTFHWYEAGRLVRPRRGEEKVLRRVVYGLWQGLCISKALRLTFPAVESITLQLTTAACCDQKEQLLGPHGGNSMMVADRGWATQNLITQSDTPCTGGYKFTLLRLALRLRRENGDANSAEALGVRERASADVLLSFAIWVI